MVCKGGACLLSGPPTSMPVVLERCPTIWCNVCCCCGWGLFCAIMPTLLTRCKLKSVLLLSCPVAALSCCCCCSCCFNISFLNRWMGVGPLYSLRVTSLIIWARVCEGWKPRFWVRRGPSVNGIFSERRLFVRNALLLTAAICDVKDFCR